jgi:hypothetical protein
MIEMIDRKCMDHFRQLIWWEYGTIIRKFFVCRTDERCFCWDRRLERRWRRVRPKLVRLYLCFRIEQSVWTTTTFADDGRGVRLRAIKFRCERSGNDGDRECLCRRGSFWDE